MNYVLWILPALAASICSAFFISLNQFLKLDKNVAMVYRGAFLAVLLLPFIFIVEPIKNNYFYLFCFVQGSLNYYGDSKKFQLSKNIGSGIVSLTKPISLTIIFITWFLINPLDAYDQSIEFFLLNILCFLLIGFCIIKINGAQLSGGSIKPIIPLVIATTTVDILNKKSMLAGAENMISAVFYYNFIVASTIGFWSITRCKKESIQFNFFNKKNLISGLSITLIALILTSCKNIAMFYTPNPAYVSAILATTPISVFILNTILKRFNIIEKDTNIKLKYALLLVVAVCSLIILAK